MTPEVKERIDQIRHGNVPEGYKKTAAGIIPVDWQCSVIRDCLQIKNNERKPISEEVRKTMMGPYPYYGPTQAQGYIDNYVSEGPAVLIGEDGDHFLKYKTKPMTLFVDGQYTVNNHAHMVVGTSKCATKWFFYAYQYKSLLNAITRQGAGRYKLTKETLEKLLIQYPSMNEQLHIIAILSAQDRLIELKESMIEKKLQQKKVLIHRLLTRQISLFSQESEWPVVRLGDVTKEISRKTERDNEFPVFTSSRSGLCLQSEYFNKSVASEDTTGYKIIAPEQFTYRAMSDDGIFTFNLSTFDFSGCVSPAYAVFAVDQKKADTKYVYYLLNSDVFSTAIRGYAQGGTRLTLKYKSLAALEIPLPNIEEQKLIGKILSTVDEEINLLRQNLEEEKQKKKALMQLLLTGIVRVTTDK